eukprot:CAMPEP_0202908410 /NCGR_PEP_ID=MMETSP1392-20130828/45922_1 /ASSEMBLY_ACC=CAM_ASM_000868 /TAXON_ID=225041 /ORGANISM="Chlamydomonas chlamydogama, Strain SAG 11-48b" /LENGTH=67 /DNA_ID=CAMNT_0049597721 /DNA_START=87 /DNA_END=287 /DNA_ORIENTATION=-
MCTPGARPSPSGNQQLLNPGSRMIDLAEQPSMAHSSSRVARSRPMCKTSCPKVQCSCSTTPGAHAHI